MRSLLYGLLLASGVVAAQDVYKCVDDQGRTTYTQGACPTNSQITTIPLQNLPDSNGFTPPPNPATPFCRLNRAPLWAELRRYVHFFLFNAWGLLLKGPRTPRRAKPTTAGVAVINA